MLLSSRSGLLPMFGARSAYTWTGATWALTSGRAYNTPTLGSELLTDGGLENWASASNLTSWTEITNGTSSVNQESSVVQAGTYAARIVLDVVGSNAGISQTITGAIGDWVLADVYMRATGGSPRVSIGAVNGIIRTPANVTWVNYDDVLRLTAANPTFTLQRVGGAGVSFYFDTLSAKKITLPTAFASVVDVAGQTVTAKPYAITTGTQAGVISHLDSTSSPANFIIAYHDGGTSIKMDKCVGGTYTNLVSATTGFVSDAVIEIRALGSNQFDCYYNGTKRGSTATVSNAEIVSNTRYGLFSTYSANLFSDGLTLGGVLIPFGF